MNERWNVCRKRIYRGNTNTGERVDLRNESKERIEDGTEEDFHKVQGVL